jgi:hypothetical protein
MPLRLKVPNNFKFTFCFGGQVPKEALAIDESFTYDVLESSHIQVSKENQDQNHKLTTIGPQIFLKCLNILKNPNPIIVEDVHVFKK